MNEEIIIKKNTKILLSIITINKNNKKGLINTIKSIIKYGSLGDQVEYIIIDSDSSDGSIEVIRKYEKIIKIKCLIEKDNGIAEGMNKGLLMADSFYTLFINSGDELGCKIPKDQLISALNNNIDICYGDYKTRLGLNRTSDLINLNFFLKGSLPHCATFTRTNMLKNNNFKVNYKVAMDWDVYFRLIYLKKSKYRKLDKYFNIMEMGGVSSKSSKLIDIERFNTLNESFGGIGADLYILGKDLQRLNNYEQSRLHLTLQSIILNSKINNILKLLRYILPKN
jgi:glycosyltransferase involved in cell wall biosynthesis